jgi:hypothetical protein
MTAAVCNRFPPFTLHILIEVTTCTRHSGGFTSKIVRLKHSIPQPSVVPDVFFSAFSGIGFSVGVVASVILFRRA